MTSWNLNHEGKISFRGVAFFLFLLFSVMMIKGDAFADPLGCTNLDNWTVFFYMFGASGDYDSSVPVELAVYSDTAVRAIHMDVTWDSTELTFEVVDFSPFTESFPGDDVDTSYELINAGNVKLEITYIDSFPTGSGSSIVNLWLKLKCFDSGTYSAVSYNGRCPNNHIVNPGGAEYGPQISGAIVGMNSIDHTLNPVSDSSLVNDTTDVAVQYTCEVTADNGFGSYWEYPKDSLDVVGVVKGTLISSNPGWSVDETSEPAKLHIYYNGSVNSTSSPQTIYYIQFENDMNHNYSEATIKRISDTLEICDGSNSDLYSIITDTASATLTTYYDAEFKWHSTSDTTNAQNVDFPVMLSNNFWVRLQDSAEVSKYRINNTEWDYIDYESWGYVNSWKWERDPEIPDDVQMTNDEDSPENIGPYPNPRDVSIIVVDCEPDTGTDIARFRPDTTKLRDLYSAVTIYPSNGIDTTWGTFQVTPPPPPGQGCPFLYVWNGSEFEEDNTVLALSEINPGVPVIDYYLLSKTLVPKDERYVIQIREFENEVSYMDRVRLVAVDHGPETKVSVTPRGEIFAYDKELAPTACVDHNGEDQLPKVKGKDGIYFVSEEPGYLILTYSRSAIWPNALYDPPPIGPDGGGPGPPPGEKRVGVVSNLTVEVQDMHGNWHELGNVPPRFYPERSFSIVEAKGLQLSDEFKVKLSWDQYYSADELKYYIQSNEKPVTVWTSLLSADNSERGEVQKLLLKSDEEYATLMPGQTIELSFLVPSSSEPGTVRDFVLQTIGYYTSLKKPSVAPTAFALLNNYPNPFNASTIINYALPEATDIKLEIFNVLGQRIRVLVNEHQSTGHKRAVWDGKDDKGTDVSSGIYFYRLQTENYSDSRKMVLMR